MHRVTHVVTLLLLASQTTGCFHSRHGRFFGVGPAFGLRLGAPVVEVVVVPPGVASSAAILASGPPPPAYVPPPPPASLEPPVGYALPPPTCAPPVVQAPLPAPTTPVVVAPPPEPEGPAVLAVKYAPGASAPVAFSQGLQVGAPGFAHSLGLEVRLTRWLALRSDYELRSEGRTWDLVGVKLSPPTSWALKPYLSVSVSGSEAYALPGTYQLGASAALGLDLFIGRHFFLEAEARYRVTPSDCCREVPHLTALAGAGVAFF